MSERLAGILVSSFTRILIPGIKVTIPLTLLSFVFGCIIALFLALVQIANVKGLKQFRSEEHMGLPRNPTYCTAVHHFLWPAVCRNYPGRFSIRCDCICPEPWRLQR